MPKPESVADCSDAPASAVAAPLGVTSDVTSGAPACAAVVSPSDGAAGALLAPEDARLLFRLGLAAIGKSRVRDAEAIFKGLAAARPGLAFPWYGLGLLRISQGKCAEAVALLRSAAVADEAERAQLQPLLGMALQLEGRRAEGAAVLERVAQGGADAAGKHLAMQLLAAVQPRALISRGV